MQKTLYDKYGGFAQINKLVMAFYDRLLDSDEIGPFFDDIDMTRQIDHQTKFFAYLMGGPASFNDDHLQRAHQSMAITDGHFDDLKVILGNTLSDAGVEAEDCEAILGAIEARRALIVTQS